ncbi:hypothetical protein OHA40_08550 [Nocardia sp. NBC_00508]|uniref:hypothetical protein n=1 Tax=Nocardia sp. NBC_00508 TaxID=2975992 RepID=UPI002E8133C6|nr:hypothetical protein [Nocardia sp. NBC_00508]WUD68153.1 hypothetical protein OHA40_08550 [Nocardia sp. NBC_00508]
MSSRLGRSIRLDQPSFGMPWEPQFWDTERWRPEAVFRRCCAWVAATRRRRWIAGILIALFVLVVFPGIIGAVSTAQTGTLASASAPNGATGWMDIKDSSGVNVSNYMFVTNNGGLLNPGKLMASQVLKLLFAPWHAVETFQIWLPGKTISFDWMPTITAPLVPVIDNLIKLIATPLMAATAAAIGAFFVAWFIVRGLISKAVVQILMMMVVAIGTPLFLASPHEVVSAHGLLIQGRDLGLSVAAGLNGDSNPNPDQLVTTMQAQMADNFVRRPLQVWNFGHVVDVRPSCKAAWSAGMMAGDEDRVKNGLKACGDSAAYEAADNPGGGQIGAAAPLLVIAVLNLIVFLGLSIRTFWAIFDGIYYGVMAIFGFSAGGYVYGPTQTFTVRCVVHGFFAAGRVAAYIIVSAFLQMFVGGLFEQAEGQEMTVYVLVGLVEGVFIVQLRKVRRGFDDGNEWTVKRVGAWIQSGGSSAGSGGGGNALGMGNAGANNSMSMLGMLAAASTINNSPATAWAFGGRLNPLNPFSRVDHLDKKNKAKGLKNRDLRAGAHGNVYDRAAAADFARAGIRSSGSWRRSERAAAFAAENAFHVTGMMGGVPYALRMAGISWGRSNKAAIVRSDIIRHADDEPLASKHLGRVLAAHKHFERYYMDPEWAGARLHGLEASVARYRGDYPGGVSISEELQDVGRQYLDSPNKQWIETLQAHVDGPVSRTSTHLAFANGQPLNQIEADRLRSWIANEHALRVQAATAWVAEDPTNLERIRALRSEIDKAAQTDQWQAGRNTTGAVSLPQPNPNTPLQAIPDRLLNNFRNTRRP